MLQDCGAIADLGKGLYGGLVKVSPKSVHEL